MRGISVHGIGVRGGSLDRGHGQPFRGSVTTVTDLGWVSHGRTGRLPEQGSAGITVMQTDLE